MKRQTLTDRQYALLQLLRNIPTPTAIALSQALNVTVQTVKKDLSCLEDLLHQYDISIVIVDNKLQMIGKQNLDRLIREERPALEFSVGNQILLILLLEQNAITLQDIADTLYLSRSKIDKEIPALLQAYPHELQAKRHYGLWYYGTWSQRFRRFVQLLEPYLFGVDFSAALSTFSATHFPLLQYITPQQIQTAQDILHQAGYTSVFSLTDVAQRHLFLHLILLQGLYPYTGRESLSLPTAPAFFKPAGETDELGQLVEQIGQHYPLFASPFAQSYVYYVLLSLPKVYHQPGMIPTQETEPLILRILEELFQLYTIDLRSDVELIRGLKQHIYTVILRRDHIAPPFMDEDSEEDLRRQYPLAVELAATAASRIGMFFHYTVPANEIPLLALHFQLALERRKTAASKIRCCIVCHFGVAASHLICGRIEQSYPELMVTSLYSYQKFCSLTQYDFDVVLSTETLPACEIPVIYITLGRNPWEEEQIGRFIQEYRIGHALKPLIESAQILHIKASDAADAIRQGGSWLEQNGYARPGYTQSILNREQISSTELEFIAIPHGNPQLVEKTILLIGRLDPPLLWKEERVSTIFLFSCPQQSVEDRHNVFSLFFRKLAEPNTEKAIHQLSQCKDDAYRRCLTELMVD